MGSPRVPRPPRSPDAPARLPHPLPPAAYFEAAFHTREVEGLFRRGFHCLATMDELPRPGDFITRDFVGEPLLLHHGTDGSIRAFLNVCAHRHALLTHAPCGHRRRLQCQYHGWEYDDEGYAVKIPDAAGFAPVSRKSEQLFAFRCERLGPLIFVSLDAHGPSLRDTLGDRVTRSIERLFCRDQRLAVTLTLDHPCNWKIPLENVLESYHVPMLHDNIVARHPGVFRLFQSPREGAEHHEIDPAGRFTAVHDSLGADSALYRALLRKLRPEASVAFEHLHAFPAMLLGQTAIVSFLQVTLPTSATTSRSLVRLYLDLGQRHRPRWEHALAPVADAVTKALFEGLMREDAPIFPDVQRGLEASRGPGVLASRECRLHAFQRFVQEAAHFRQEH
jgi:choline monooxygenase